LSDPKQVAFAPNTHEFVTRLYSCLDASRPIRVLTTASEFHSFRRQTRRMQEAGQVTLVEVPPTPWATFTERFIAAARSGPWDMVWLSHVFFDSAYVVQDLEAICAAAPAEAMVCIDGYHAFCALPVDLAKVHQRAFYLAGGYKYAMSGEGVCPLAIPPGCELRPVDTGWYASFETLSPGSAAQTVQYSAGGMRFWGATFDATGLYRFNAVQDWLLETGTSIADIHRHATTLQKHFLDALARVNLQRLRVDQLVMPMGTPRGNFLVFEVHDAAECHRRIAAANIGIDRRGNRLRFGFGVYQDEHDVRRLVETLNRALG
jgi:kynureninase